MRRAFTLLEMTVVLAIIALLTHLAVRELGAYRDAKLAKAADRQLEEIRESAKRFFDDVGRLPRLQPQTNAVGEVVWTLSELWKKPSSLNSRRLVEEDGVTLAVGWNGPYLKLPFGRERLLDPWGNSVELEDSAGLTRLWAAGDKTLTNVCHYGASAQEFGRRDISLVPDGGLFADLILTVDAGAYSGDVKCSWYGAYENAVTNATASPVVSGSQIVFRKVPCGRRIVKITTDKTSVRLVNVTGPVTEIAIKVQ